MMIRTPLFLFAVVLILLLDSSRSELYSSQLKVGIIALKCPEKISIYAHEPDDYNSCLNGSYVDWVSQSGAVPFVIPFDLTRDRLEKVIESLDAVFIPGIGLELEDRSNKRLPSKMMEVLHLIILKVRSINSSKRYLPIFAVGKAMEALLVSENHLSTDIIDTDLNDLHTDTGNTDDNKKDSIERDLLTSRRVKVYEEGFLNSKFWPREMKDSFEGNQDKSFLIFKSNLAMSLTGFLQNSILYNSYWITSTFDVARPKSKSDRKKEEKKTFVASIEHKIHPFIGVQWEPAINQYENTLSPYANVDRSQEAIEFLGSTLNIWLMNLRKKKYPRKIDGTSYRLMLRYSNQELIADIFPGYQAQRVYTFPKLEEVSTADSENSSSSTSENEEDESDDQDE